MSLQEVRSMSSQGREELASILQQLYLSEGRAAVASYLDCPYGSVAHYFAELGIDMKEIHSTRDKLVRDTPKYPNPFIQDSSIKYYLLGFILGDGCLRTRDGHPTALNLSSSDYELIEQISHIFPGCKIKGPNRGNYTIDLYDRPICNTLVSLGFVSAKSKVGMKLPSIPNEFRIQFLCGLLDSDGCVRADSRGGTISMFWAGHPSYMNDVYSMLNTLGYYPTITTRSGSNPLTLVTIGSSKDTMDLLCKMNECSPISFDRKRSKTMSTSSPKASRGLSSKINEYLISNPPKNRIELLELATKLNISESNIRHRLSRMRIMYSHDYSNCGRYERKYKEKDNN